MNRSTIEILVGAGLIILLVGIGILVYYLVTRFSKKNDNLDVRKINVPKQKYKDPTLKAPRQQVVLGSLQRQNTGINPWCVPTWYALRYVKKDGGYSDLGPWSDKIQVNVNSHTPRVCEANTPIVGIKKPPDYNPFSTGITVALHRQHGKFDPTDEGEVVGQLYPLTAFGLQWGWTDVLRSDIQTIGSCCRYV